MLKSTWLAALLLARMGMAQTGVASGQLPQKHIPLDPARAEVSPLAVGTFQKPLPEEYIWTTDDAAVVTRAKEMSQIKRDDWKVEPHCFRSSFTVRELPKVATVYVAGPRAARIYANGMPVTEMKADGCTMRENFCLILSSCSGGFREAFDIRIVDDGLRWESVGAERIYLSAAGSRSEGGQRRES
jgi:hypothetical protein